MEKKSYQIIHGGVYEIQAYSASDALEKFYAYDNGSVCLCKKGDDCFCVEFVEANTMLMNADPEDPEA